MRGARSATFTGKRWAGLSSRADGSGDLTMSLMRCFGKPRRRPMRPLWRRASYRRMSQMPAIDVPRCQVLH